MEMFQEIVEASADAFNRPSKRHLILPTITNGCEGDGVDVVGHKDAMSTSSMSRRLVRHSSEHGLETSSIGVIMSVHALYACPDAHLPTSHADRGVDKIEIG